MIVYDLRCHKGHVFETWFADSATCDRQAAAAKIACPECGSRKIAKAPMAPNIAKAAPKSAPAEAEKSRRMLDRVRREVESKCDYVGAQFAEEARKIHYNEAQPRNIYGEASRQDAIELQDEGIAFGVIPWAPRHDA